MRYRLSVQFEFDPWKSENNKPKHGIDFVEAKALWKIQDRALARQRCFREALHGHWDNWL